MRCVSGENSSLGGLSGHQRHHLPSPAHHGKPFPGPKNDPKTTTWPKVYFLIKFSIFLKEKEAVREVEYDEDGCYAPDQYMAAVNSGDVFQDYSFFIGNTLQPLYGAGLLMLVFGILGICGNSLSIFVLLKKEKICFNYLLVCPPLL